MNILLAALAAFVAFVTGVLAQGLMINTPTNVVVCQPIQLTWTGGTSPYFVSIHPGASPNDAALLSFPQTDATSLTWIVNITAGTSLDLTIRDSTGTTAQSAPFTVNGGPDSACVSQSGGPTSTGSNTSRTTAGQTSSSGATTSTPSTSTGATTRPTTSPASSTSGSTSRSGTPTGSASATSTGNSAPTQVAHIAAAGLIGAAVIALMA